jgi:hypothetical protein
MENLPFFVLLTAGCFIVTALSLYAGSTIYAMDHKHQWFWPHICGASLGLGICSAIQTIALLV